MAQKHQARVNSIYLVELRALAVIMSLALVQLHHCDTLSNTCNYNGQTVSSVSFLWIEWRKAQHLTQDETLTCSQHRAFIYT